MQSLYRIEARKVKETTFVSIVCRRGNIEATTAEKVIPPILEYNSEGEFNIIGAKEVLEGLTFHPYKANSKDFSEERLADLEVAGLFKQLEHFPTLYSTIEGDHEFPHPIAEYIYSEMVYLKPNTELQERLNRLSYVQKTQTMPIILNKLASSFHERTGHKLDLFSVPKKKVGTFAYIADKQGIARVAKTFGFGFHRSIPCDRAAREISSLKACERFKNPVTPPANTPEFIKPYVTTLRVAIVGLEHSMLDGGDLFLSGIPKIACQLTRKRVEKDVSKVPIEDRNLVYKPFRSGIEVYHEQSYSVDETEQMPGAIRLILPNGVKIACQPFEKQAYDGIGQPVDLLMDFETFAKKGALSCFAMKDPENYTKDMTLAEAKEYFLGLEKETVILEGKTYEGYIVELPVMRPGQRYTELAKSTRVSVDMISKAILKKKYKVKPFLEEEYSALKTLRKALFEELVNVN